jgi:putative ABC transport system permease protein
MSYLFFKLAFRNILRNRMHSVINIIGFSMGIATMLYIFLFVKSETSFDNFYPDGNRIYRVTETSDSKGDHSVSGLTRYPEAQAIANTIPGVEDFCRVSNGSKVKCYKDKDLYRIDILRFADDNFFRFFSFRLLSGDPLTALNSAEKIVLSASRARLIFGNTNPIGKNIVWNQKLLTVSGISEDPPKNTHLQFDAIVSIKYIEQDKKNFWLGWGGGMEFLSYLKLTPGVSHAQIEAGLPALFYENINKQTEAVGFKLSGALQNISEIHLSKGKTDYDCPDNRNKKDLMEVAGIGLLILILAMVNYISLYVAQKSEKTKDISLLIVHGAGRWHLIVQAYIEVLIISVVSSFSGIYLFSLYSPVLNGFLNTSVTMNGNVLATISYLGVLVLVLSLIVTLLSNQKIIQFRIAETFNNGILAGRKRTMTNNILVTFQFTIVVFLIISVLVINKQNRFVLNHETGFAKENILSLFPGKEFKNNELAGFKLEMHTIPEIRNVSLSSEGVGTGLTMNGYNITGQTETILLNVIYTDSEFLDCFGVKLISGRNFKEQTTQDNFSILVNQKLVKHAGWKDPLNQTIQRNGLMTVIGTVNDFNFASLKSEIAPLIIMCNPAYDGWGYNCINLRYQTGDVQSLIKKISGVWERDYPGVPYDISFLDDQLKGNYTLLNAQRKIITFFSFLSIIIACIGLFGMASFTARRRTKEISIRRINGANITEVIVMLNQDLLKWVILSFVLSVLPAVFFMKKWLQGYAFKTELSWWTFALAGLLTLVIALLTVSWQSWRAATRNPAETIRYE